MGGHGRPYCDRGTGFGRHAEGRDQGKLLIYFAVFFLLGYVLYSTLCAAVGSMVNSEQEAQQLQFLVMMPMILAVIVIVQYLPASDLPAWPSGDRCSRSRRRCHVYRIAMQQPPGGRLRFPSG